MVISRQKKLETDLSAPVKGERKGGDSARRANRAQNQFGFFQIHTAIYSQETGGPLESAEEKVSGIDRPTENCLETEE